MKKLLTIIALAVTVLTAQAQSFYATNNLSAAGHLVLSNTPIDTISLSVWTTNSAGAIVYLYDGHLIKTNAAYTNYTAARTEVVTTQINSTGSTNLYTNFVWKTSANAVAAANVAAVPLAALTVSPGVLNPSTLAGMNGEIQKIDIPRSFAQFLVVSNSAAGTSFLLEYRNR